MNLLLRVLTSVAIALTFTLAAFPAFADDLDPVLNTKAKVTPGSHPPVIEALFELAGTNTTQPDDRNFTPSPAPKLSQICTYAVISDPAGTEDITGAYADVRHPDGSLKIQIHQEKMIDGYATQTALINSARQLGQITRARADELLWMLDPEKNQATFWWGCFDYEVHQPAGTYSVSEWAVDRGSGRSTELVNNIRIAPIVSLSIDFNIVDWGIVAAGVKKVVAGDDTFSLNDGKPTVWNQGNVNAKLTISNTVMTGAEFGKAMDQFDAQLLDQRVNYTAGQVVTLDGPLEPCTPEQIEFSLQPPVDLAPDTYTGKLFIRIMPCV